MSGDDDDSTSSTSNRQRGGLNAPNATINTEGDVVAGSKTVHNYYGGGPGEPPWDPPPAVALYLNWLKGQRMVAHLRGVGGADLPLDLGQIYVPLSLHHHLRGDYLGGRRRAKAEFDGGEFEIAALFARLDGRRHAILLGDPGSGKTTALRKVSQLVTDEALRASDPDTPRPSEGKDARLLEDSLEPGVVPIFVRLRGLAGADLDLPLRDLVARELERASEGAINSTIFARLWDHGRLVLLLDGLDEIANADDRAAFCQKLNTFRVATDRGALRLVVTCRFNGYRDLATKLDDGFARVEIQPLTREQARTLIQRWFHEAAAKLPGLSERAADAQAGHLADALDDPRFLDDRRSMYATPLILTLLCVVCQRGHAIPQNRAAFYEKCLEVLLEGWHLSKRDGEALAPAVARPPLGLEAMIEVLRDIAYRIHESTDRYKHGRNGVILLIRRRLKKLGCVTVPPVDLFEWFRGRAEVLEDLSTDEFGFFHLGVQECGPGLRPTRRAGRWSDASSAWSSRCASSRAPACASSTCRRGCSRWAAPRSTTTRSPSTASTCRSSGSPRPR